ncbi:SMC-Scp complex subunit ScpB [Stenotrophomonas sp. JC08]|uniref:SMC-Scp complex subunit ScpB n=1 Tax=Stenotrophomonas sp. JC08 TaxID=3445779 RepID=UPI003FA22C29
MDQPLINRIIEGALLASSQPVTLAQLQALFPEDEPAPPGSVERALELLAEGCSGRGVELVEVASGFRYQITAEVHDWVARLWTERKTRYTRATLETLALIAYRQPITRGEIEQVRGVAVSSNIIQALEEREWIRVIGHRDVPGKPALFGTTKGFLDYFGLKRLDELPPLSELRDLGELEPQLPLGDDGQPAAPLPAGISPPDGSSTTAATGTPGAASNTATDPATVPETGAVATDTALTGEPDAAPGERVAEVEDTENNAVATTSVAVEVADSEPEADAENAGRSQTE